MNSCVVPSSPEDRKKLKTMLVEMTHCLQRADNERESMKEIASEIEEQFNISKKIANKLARTMYKRNYSDLQAENEHFEFLYETLIEGKNNNQLDAA